MLTKLIKNKITDTTPSVIEQAAAVGWNASVFFFGKAEASNIAHFNPSLVERPDGLWLIVRRALFDSSIRVGMNSIWAFKLNPEDYGPLHGRRVAFPATRKDEQFEDPRAIYHNGKTYISCCNFVWYGSTWSGAHQMIAPMGDDWIPQVNYHPLYGGNGGGIGKNTRNEKNWVWFFHEDRLHLLYNVVPWTVAEFDHKFVVVTDYVHPDWSVAWRHGEIRGGTPPVRVDDLYWTFFHSSVSWQPPFRRYHMGALAFDAAPPFMPRLITRDPMLTGSQNDLWKPKKPCCIFPAGSRLKDGKWLVTMGLNDLECAYVEIPHEDVLVLAEEL